MDSSELTAPLVEHRSRKLGKRNELQTILVFFFFTKTGNLVKNVFFLFTKTGNLVKNVLTRFWKQNESTLDLVDGLTTSVAELQDTCAYAKEGGHAADKDTTETAPIIYWLAKVQEVQRRERPQPSTSDWNVKSEDMRVFDMNASEWNLSQSLLKMEERINQFLPSYDSLLDDVELANTKLGWNNRFLGKCGIVGVAVAGLASLGFVIAGVGLMLKGHTSREKILGAVLAIPGLGAIIFLRSCETVAFDQADELTRTRNRVKQTIAALREICTAVEKLSEGSTLQTLTASISDLQTEINTKPESRLEIADVNPNVREKGEKLIQLCNTLDLELTELEKQIQVLRDQVVGAHRARYKFIR